MAKNKSKASKRRRRDRWIPFDYSTLPDSQLPSQDGQSTTGGAFRPESDGESQMIQLPVRRLSSDGDKGGKSGSYTAPMSDMNLTSRHSSPQPIIQPDHEAAIYYLNSASEYHFIAVEFFFALHLALLGYRANPKSPSPDILKIDIAPDTADPTSYKPLGKTSILPVHISDNTVLSSSASTTSYLVTDSAPPAGAVRIALPDARDSETPSMPEDTKPGYFDLDHKSSSSLLSQAPNFVACQECVLLEERDRGIIVIDRQTRLCHCKKAPSHLQSPELSVLEKNMAISQAHDQLEGSPNISPMSISKHPKSQVISLQEASDQPDASSASKPPVSASRVKAHKTPRKSFKPLPLSPSPSPSPARAVSPEKSAEQSQEAAIIPEIYDPNYNPFYVDGIDPSAHAAPAPEQPQRIPFQNAPKSLPHDRKIPDFISRLNRACDNAEIGGYGIGKGPGWGSGPGPRGWPHEQQPKNRE